jgi:hypothetical protein
MEANGQKMARLLNLMGELFPGYNKDGTALQEASIAVVAVAGAMGAHMLLRDPSGELLRKYIRVLQTQTEHFAHGSVATMKDQRSRMS